MAGRRSSRIARQQNRPQKVEEGKTSPIAPALRHRRATGSIDDYDEDLSTSTDSEYQDVAVKSKGTRKKRVKRDEKSKKLNVDPRNRRGFLEQFAENAPLDVILEIFKYLWPREILHLSRTSKSLRELLMSRSSAPIWRAARINSGLPPLPPDLSEPRYASLAFDPYCNVSLIEVYDPLMSRSRIPPSFFTGNQLPNAGKDWSRDIFAMTALETRGRFIPGRWDGTQSYHLPSIESLYSEYKQVEDDALALEAWRNAKHEAYLAIFKHSKECEFWRNEMIADREEELDEMRSERADEIIARLAEDGWDELDLEEFRNTHHCDLYRPERINEYNWESQKARFTDDLRTIQDKRLRKKRHRLLLATFSSYCEQQTYTVYLPIGDLLLSSAKITKLLGEGTPEKAVETVYSEMVKAEVPRANRKWIRRVEKQLLRVLRMVLPNTGIEAVRSLLTVFRCLVCRSLLWYPKVLVHGCFSKGWADWKEHRKQQDEEGLLNLDSWSKSFDLIWRYRLGLWLLDPAKIVYEPDASNHMDNILSLCGINPESVSVEELEVEDPFLECLECGKGDFRFIIGWTQAMSHPHQDCLRLVEKLPGIRAAILDQYTQFQTHLRWRFRIGILLDPTLTQTDSTLSPTVYFENIC
ncbi:hypothetical protein AAF712_005943 [Marasmius tenuissimus]|uniref:F-box domain-containing protein n=1 Tax=Marasmius tenuissimus TaxID=585030 RepID=A0ABR3A1N7_9AGAR